MRAVSCERWTVSQAKIPGDILQVFAKFQIEIYTSIIDHQEISAIKVGFARQF